MKEERGAGKRRTRESTVTPRFRTRATVRSAVEGPERAAHRPQQTKNPSLCSQRPAAATPPGARTGLAFMKIPTSKTPRVHNCLGLEFVVCPVEEGERPQTPSPLRATTSLKDVCSAGPSPILSKGPFQCNKFNKYYGTLPKKSTLPRIHPDHIFTDVGIPYFRTIQFFWRGYPELAKTVLETDRLSQGHLPLEERR